MNSLDMFVVGIAVAIEHMHTAVVIIDQYSLEDRFELQKCLFHIFIMLDKFAMDQQYFGSTVVVQVEHIGIVVITVDKLELLAFDWTFIGKSEDKMLAQADCTVSVWLKHCRGTVKELRKLHSKLQHC